MVDILELPREPGRRLLQAALRMKIHWQYRKNLDRYKAVAHPDKVIRISHGHIKFKLGFGRRDWRSPQPCGIVQSFDGCRISRFDEQAQLENPKCKAIFEHFGRGIPWRQTALFRDYAQLLKTRKIRRCRTIEQLESWYHDRIDPLFEDIKQNGFVLPSQKRPEVEFLYYHIGPTGEILVKGGNHRLYIARFLGIRHIPCRIWWRHEQWQIIRDEFAHMSPQQRTQKYPHLITHPDLQDIV